MVWFFRNCLCQYYGTKLQIVWPQFWIAAPKQNGHGFRYLGFCPCYEIGQFSYESKCWIFDKYNSALALKASWSFYLVFLLESTFGLFTALFGWVACNQPDYWEWHVQLSINISLVNISQRLIGQLDWSVNPARYLNKQRSYLAERPQIWSTILTENQLHIIFILFVYQYSLQLDPFKYTGNIWQNLGHW